MLTKDDAYTEGDIMPCAEVNLATRCNLHVVVKYNNLKYLV